jgi:transposase-like protein
MRYSYEYKKKCVELYKTGEFPETPVGLNTNWFRKKIREWFLISESCGMEALKHKSSNRRWTAAERYELVARVLAGESTYAVALSVGISTGQLYRWVRIYRTLGYNGLENLSAGRKLKESNMKTRTPKKNNKLKESEYEELIRLRNENEYLKTENAFIKKLIALRGKKKAAPPKAKEHELSKNSANKDTD